LACLGLSLYFASQGAGRLGWPLLAGLIRLVIAVGGGSAVLLATGSIAWVFASLGIALVVYGALLVSAVASGVWFRNHDTRDGRSPARPTGRPTPSRCSNQRERDHRGDA
jgi:hypothetical protein